MEPGAVSLPAACRHMPRIIICKLCRVCNLVVYAAVLKIQVLM